jgi:hypothetical protein
MTGQLELPAAPDAGTASSHAPNSSVLQQGIDLRQASLVVQTLEELCGLPLAGIHVSVNVQGSVADVNNKVGLVSETQSTDVSGRVEFSLPPGIDLVVGATTASGNIQSSALEVEALRDHERRFVTIRLPVEHTIRFCGRVLGRQSHVPVAGAKASLLFADDLPLSIDVTNLPASHVSNEALSDADGVFELRTLPPAHVYLCVTAEGFSPVLASVGCGHHDPKNAAGIFLDESATLEVRVVRRDPGSVHDITLKAVADSEQLEQGDGLTALADTMPVAVIWAATTDIDGRCVLKGLASNIDLALGFQTVTGNAWPGPNTVRLKPGECRSIECSIGSACRVSGRLENRTGLPIANQPVWILSAQPFTQARFFSLDEAERVRARTTTDATGQFQFLDVGVGSWLVGPAPSAATDSNRTVLLAPIAEVVNIDPSALERSITIKSDCGLFISGGVVGSSGVNSEFAAVRACKADSGAVMCSNADRSGHFVLGPLMAGEYALTARSAADLESAPIVVNAGARDVVIRMVAGGGIEGKIVACSGRFDAHTDLVLRRHSAMGDRVKIARVGQDGTFGVFGLDPSSYDLIARTSDGCVGIVSGVAVEPGATVRSLVITPQPGGILCIHYNGSRPSRMLQIMSGAVILVADVVRAGGTSCQVVPEGELTLRLLDDGAGHPLERHVEMRSGASQEITLVDDE